jgi:hypothetical protein
MKQTIKDVFNADGTYRNQVYELNLGPEYEYMDTITKQSSLEDQKFILSKYTVGPPQATPERSRRWWEENNCAGGYIKKFI